MYQKVYRLDIVLSVFVIHVKQIHWNVVINVPSRIETRSQIAGKFGVISFTIPNCTSLLNVGHIVNPISHGYFLQSWNGQNKVELEYYCGYLAHFDLKIHEVGDNYEKNTNSHYVVIANHIQLFSNSPRLFHIIKVVENLVRNSIDVSFFIDMSQSTVILVLGRKSSFAIVFKVRECRKIMDRS